MVKELKQAQTTVKMSESIKKEINLAAETLGISSMEYIRRACREKLDHDAETAQYHIALKKLSLKFLTKLDFYAQIIYLCGIQLQFRQEL